MTIGPLEGGDPETRRAFADLRALRDRSARAHPDLDLSILSMGEPATGRLRWRR
ncbi:MAG: hypothetical protein R3E12_08080 [Candidatus Eisenbacteria bacterium]